MLSRLRRLNGAKQMGQKMLTQFQEQMILSVCPRSSRIENVEYFQHEYLPCPIRVTVHLPDDTERVLVLRLARHSDGSIQRETKLLPILSDLGLPVPEILAGPQDDPDTPDHQAVAVYSLLSGINLQEMSMKSTEGCDFAARLVLEAATELAELTPRIRIALGADVIPEKTLS